MINQMPTLTSSVTRYPSSVSMELKRRALPEKDGCCQRAYDRNLCVDDLRVCGSVLWPTGHARKLRMQTRERRERRDLALTDTAHATYALSRGGGGGGGVEGEEEEEGRWEEGKVKRGRVGRSGISRVKRMIVFCMRLLGTQDEDTRCGKTGFR